MAGIEVVDILDDNNQNVRKWGTQLLAVAPYSAPMPDKFFDDASGKPLALPAQFKILGYITTDGMKASRSIESTDTQMVQDLEPVRSDITGRTRTMQCTFGEMNAWVKALAHGVPVESWPASKDADWEYTDGELADFPYMRLIALMQDGTGEDAHYRVEAGYKVKVTDQGDLTHNRTDAEGEDTTFTFYRDAACNKTYFEGERHAKKASGSKTAAKTAE